MNNRSAHLACSTRKLHLHIQSQRRKIIPKASHFLVSSRYICLICYRAISRVGGDQSAELHQALHAEGAGFPCPQCCKMFETEEKLTVHAGIHAVNISTYHCGVCDTREFCFRRRIHLRVMADGTTAKSLSVADVPHEFRGIAI